MEENSILTISQFPEPLHDILCKIVFGENSTDDNIATALTLEQQKTVTEFIQSIEARRLASGRKARRTFVKSNFSNHVRKLFKVNK